VPPEVRDRVLEVVVRFAESSLAVELVALAAVTRSS
jgi:hypothetical protein